MIQTQGHKDVVWKLSADYVRINPCVVRTMEKPYEISRGSVGLRMMVSEMFSRMTSFCILSAHAAYQIKHFQLQVVFFYDKILV